MYGIEIYLEEENRLLDLNIKELASQNDNVHEMSVNLENSLKFIDVAELPILKDNGSVSAEFAKEFAETEFEKYRIIQDRLFQSDFDRFSVGNLLPLDIE